MKTSEFDNMIRQALLEEAASDDAAEEVARGRVWQKANPPKMFSLTAVLFRVAAAAILVLLLTTAYFMWIQKEQPAKQMAQKNEIRMIAISTDSLVKPAQNVVFQTIYRDRFVASVITHDTVVMQKTEVVYSTAYDTVFIEKQHISEPLIAGGNSHSNDVFPIENTPQKQVRGILFWRTKTAFPNNSATADVRRDKNKQPFTIPVISAQ